MLKLVQLFQNPEPWIIELDSRAWYNDPIKDDNGQYHYIYCWVNLDTQWCYVGKHTSNLPIDDCYLGSSTNPHYWNSRELHPFKLLILSYESSNTDALLLESLIIDDDLINKYSSKGLFNLQPGGSGYSINWINAGRLKMLELYPETNGLPRSMIEEGAEIHSQNSIIRTILSKLKYLKDNNYEINAYNYYHYAYPGSNMWDRHIPRVLSRLDDLKSHPDWTEEMSFIFDNIVRNQNPESKGRNKYIIISGVTMS
jgi:hypothetical protein